MTDLAAGDRLVIDLLGTLPSEAAWEDSHIAATTGGHNVTLDDGSVIFLANAALATIENALTLV